MSKLNQQRQWDYPKTGQHNYKDLEFKMSAKKMADVLYALIVCHGRPFSIFRLDQEQTRKQDTYNLCNMRIEIAPENEADFEEMSGCILEPIEQIYGATHNVQTNRNRVRPDGTVSMEARESGTSVQGNPTQYFD